MAILAMAPERRGHPGHGPRDVAILAMAPEKRGHPGHGPRETWLSRPWPPRDVAMAPETWGETSATDGETSDILRAPNIATDGTQ